MSEEVAIALCIACMVMDLSTLPSKRYDFLNLVTFVLGIRNILCSSAMSIAHIIGLGRSGVAAARLLQREGWQVSVSDAGQSETLVDQQRLLEAEGISVELGTRFSLEALAHTPERPDRIVVSPGVSWQLPALVAAREQGIEVIGELELAWRYLQNRPWVGITGTNGKTTTTALVAAIFETAGPKGSGLRKHWL